MEPKPKPDFCCHCKHLLGKRHSFENAEAWRCYNPANILSKGFNLVTGAALTQYVCENIVAARGTQDKCMGFELYEPPVHAPTIPPLNPVYSPTTHTNPVQSSSLNRLKAKLKNLSVDDL